MANVNYGVNIIPKNNTVSIGNSDHPWKIVSPNLIGIPIAPTAAAGTNSTQVATTAFVANELSGKLSVNLGSAHAGKFLVVNSEGDIEPITMSAWNGGSF